MTILCLQGGGEFGPECREMDRELVELAAGPVLVAPLAAAVGPDYEQTGARAVRYFTELGAQAQAVPDPRTDLAAGLAALREGAMVILPGGSPARLRDALAGPVSEVLRERFEQGVLLCGASAGAMLLCEWTIVPDQGDHADQSDQDDQDPHQELDDRRQRAVRGLGLVAGVLVVPHYRPGAAVPWQAPAGVQRLGIPEQSGVLVNGGRWRSLGVAAAQVLDSGPLPLGELAR